MAIKRPKPEEIVTKLRHTVNAIAVAMAASTALPPLANMLSPACAASGCDVTTMLSAKMAERRDG